MGIKDRDWYWDKHDELTGRKRRAPGLWRALIGTRTMSRSRQKACSRLSRLARLAVVGDALFVMLLIGVRGAFPGH